MQLIVGLGNPGTRYHFTRHNFGFLVLDFYLKIINLHWANNPKFNAIYAKTPTHIFIKPQSFYNATGTVVQNFLHFYKIPTYNLLVICDDFNLPFGQFRFRSHGSAGGNNGLKSLIETLGTDQFARLRLGTGNSNLQNNLDNMDFVLSKFTPTERANLPQLLTDITTKLKTLL